MRPPFEHNFEHRYGLLAPTPTHLSFTVDVPIGARFAFSHALTKDARSGDAVTFNVSAKVDGTERTLYEKRLALDPKGEDWRWFDVRLPLDDLAGKRIELALRTTAPAGNAGVGIWGSPIIDTPRVDPKTYSEAGKTAGQAQL